MLTATATTSSTSSYQCTTSTCVGVTSEKMAEFRKVQELANQIAKRDKLVFTPLVVDGKIGPNTVALIQQLFARYKPAATSSSISSVTAPSIAANVGAMINYLLGFLAIGTPNVELPSVSNPTSIPGVPPAPITPTQPGAGTQVTTAPSTSYLPPATGWSAWSLPQKALVVGGGAVAVVALASVLGGKKKAPAAGAVAGLRGLFGLGRSRRSRRSRR